VLVGYFAISHKTLKIKKDTSKTLKKKLTGFSNTKKEIIPCYLIGQLSKNYSPLLGGADLVSGNDLLNLAFKNILDAYSAVGGRIILVECADIIGLKEFYEKHGFKPYDKARSENNRELIQYIRAIKD
jgi:hypothetical protein